MASSRELLESSMRMLQADWMLNLEVNRTAGHNHGDHDGMSGEKPWGEVVFASILINLTTLMGVFLWASALARRKSGHVSTTVSILSSNMFDFVLMPSFAAGALIATSVFLIIPESIELLGGASLDGHEGHDDHAGHDHRWLEEEEDHDEHGAIAWKFGASLMAGYLLPILLGALFPLPAGVVATEEEQQSLDDVKEMAMDDDTKEQPEEAADKEESVVAEIVECKEHVPQQLDLALASSILLGDGFHNLADGIFVGNAFLLCDKSVAYTIAAATIYHEIAQELADYVILTGACGLSPPVALTLNFASGFSVLLGAFLILALELTPEATGAMLSLSAGVYLYIAASECMPLVHAQKESRSPIVKLVCILMFAVGAVPIGLVLINHSHGCGH